MITVMMTMMGHGAHPTEGVGGTGRQPLYPATGRDRAAGQSPVGLIFRYNADDVMNAGDAGDAGDVVPPSRANFAENVQPENLKILKWMENGWKMAWIEISKS